MKILGALEVKRKWCFQAKHVAGMYNSLADLITRCEPSRINAELKCQRPDVNWCEQVMGGEEEEKCFAILRGNTRSDVLRRRLEELTSLAAVGEVERVERGNVLVRSTGIRARGSGRAGGVHGLLLHGPREPGADNSGQTGRSRFLP